MTEIELNKGLEGLADRKNRQARFSKSFEYIIDSENQRVELSDPRIVYVNPEPRNSYGSLLVVDLYKKHNRNIRISKETDKKILRYGKKICSGRECLPSVSITGAVLKDINEDRKNDEITIYRTPIDQHGPCQNGAWPLLWDTFSKRLNLKNIIFYAFPNYTNKYLGLSADIIVSEHTNFLIGHYLIEARNALQCIAEDKIEALRIFEEETCRFIENIKNNKKTLKTGLIQWARNIRQIPLKTSVEETTKILIFGGFNLMFDHYPVEDFFLEQGIIVKVVDIAESMNFILGETSIRWGVRKGKFTPKEQFSSELNDLTDLNEQEKKEALRAKRKRNTMKFLDSQCKLFRRLIGKSGLLFDSYADFVDLLEEGNKYVSSNSFTETPLIVGRFMHSIKEEIYDGLINLGTFNCQPAMNSQAIIRPLANKSNIPYAAIDCEGPWISTNQRRLLETIAVQAKRVREKKNLNLK